jgi:hypothetical protein
LSFFGRLVLLTSWRSIPIVFRQWHALEHSPNEYTSQAVNSWLYSILIPSHGLLISGKRNPMVSQLTSHLFLSSHSQFSVILKLQVLSISISNIFSSDVSMTHLESLKMKQSVSKPLGSKSLEFLNSNRSTLCRSSSSSVLCARILQFWSKFP